MFGKVQNEICYTFPFCYPHFYQFRTHLSNYGPKCSQPVKLQDSFVSVISPKLIELIIFCMHIDIKENFDSFWMSVVNFAQMWFGLQNPQMTCISTNKKIWYFFIFVLLSVSQIWWFVYIYHDLFVICLSLIGDFDFFDLCRDPRKKEHEILLLILCGQRCRSMANFVQYH